ncbi:hypothetical protein IQ22_01158 [Pseudomonas duriflava]|uniref:Uncharacterized protein n=1 Tax=Pseudomonas duriflava TaxID=459528 RepID=A0A562QKY2_9PSED|nr:hypothetical protein [Pseudomonas duriflava]TWI56706.1 hypothetical protein IQ22_01158 [Pseudomonas duriflava]
MTTLYDPSAAYNVKAPEDAYSIGRLIEGKYYDYQHRQADGSMGPMNAHLEGDRLISDDQPGAGKEIGRLVDGRLVNNGGKTFDLVKLA